MTVHLLKNRQFGLLVLAGFLMWFISFSVAHAAAFLSFDGVNDYVDVGNDSSLNLGTDFEISVWVKLSSSVSGSFINRIDSGGAYNQYWYISTKGDNSGKLEASIGDSTNFSQVFSTIAINDNKWHKVVWIRDGDTQSILIDGIDRTDVNYIDAGIGDINPPEKVYIGADIESNDWFFDGDIDEVEIKIDDVIKGLWHFDGGGGDSTVDSSGNGNIGAISGATWVVTELISGGSATRVYTPKIELLTPVTDQYYSKTLVFNYKASDKDDEIDQPEFGLRKDPVAFYYNKTDRPSYVWTLIADSQSAEGTFLWDTSVLPDGEYRLRLGVSGADGDFNQVVTGTFAIDNTPPTFSLNIDPTFSQGESIQIEIETSEILKISPILTVTQLDHESIEVPLVTQVVGKTFIGTYQVIKGFDGPANVSVSGEDLSGNQSSIIVGGKTFAVGASPPPAPTIEFPENNSRFTDPVISLAGFGLNAHRVIATVNGIEEYVRDANQYGNFRIENIRLDSKINKGRNFIDIISVDRAGNISQPSTIEITVNNPPQIKLLGPFGRRSILKDLVRINWEASDFNEDSLVYRVELSNDRGQTWGILAANLTETEFSWDSTTVPDGSNYLMRVVAFDGSLETSDSSHRLNIINNLPTIILENTGDFFTNEQSKTFKGLVRSKTDLLTKLEFSTDDGNVWNYIVPGDGVWDAQFERFEFQVPSLTVGAQEIILRGFTASGRKVANAKRLKVFFDNRAPEIKPNILSEETTNNNRLITGGSVTDNFSGIKRVEYSIDGSIDSLQGDLVWYGANIKSGLEARSALYEINHLEPLIDGEYRIGVRVIDRADNVSEIKTQIITIDATPPRIGSFTFRTEGEEMLFPDELGILEVLPQVSLSLKLAIAGNPQKIKLSTNEDILDLEFDSQTELWGSDLSFVEEGIFILKVEAEDELGNKVMRELAIISTLPPGEAEAKFQSEKTSWLVRVWKGILDFFGKFFDI